VTPAYDDSQKDLLLRLLVETNRDYAVYLLDPGGIVQTCNAGSQRITGFRSDELIGRPFSLLYPQEHVRRGWPEREMVLSREQGSFEDEGWRVGKDGSRYWANVIITPISQAGELRGYSIVMRDLTDRKHQEEALRQSEERFRLLVEGVIDYAIFMLDPNGFIMTWNVGAQRIKGFSAEEIIGQHFSRFYPLDAIQGGWPEHELQVAAELGRFEDEGWRVRKDGSQFWASVIITALRDERGHLRGFGKVTRDLSERRRVEALETNGAQREEMLEAERSARIEAQRAVHIKDEFLATLSHELRTPLNAILGWAQILRKHSELKVDDLDRGAEAIERNARAQVQLIDELLDLSRIMAGRIRLDVQRIALGEIIDGLIESMQPAAQAKGIHLEKIVEATRELVSGDPTRVQQVMWNLMSNAIKFTPKGGRIRLMLQRQDSQLEFSVSDTGIGIPLDYLPRVFDRFSQKDSSTARSYGGLGLGLAIAKQLTELHGGTLTAKSAGEGKGAIFVLSLPISYAGPEDAEERRHAADSSAPEEEALLPSLAGVRVLVVDDEIDARELVKRVLEEQGATVGIAASGEEALNLLETGETDVLVSDIGMPGMDGYQLMRRIRAEEPMGKHIPAVALTAFARAEDRKRAILAGYQSHLSKPFDIAELVIVVAGLAGRT
jgi:PAS domain S-box-containing protein